MYSDSDSNSTIPINVFYYFNQSPSGIMQAILSETSKSISFYIGLIWIVVREANVYIKMKSPLTLVFGYPMHQCLQQPKVIVRKSEKF